MYKTISILLAIFMLLHLNSFAGKKFIFDPKKHKWYAVENGRVIKSGRASGGKKWCPDTQRRCRTPIGQFSVYHKRGSDCVSSKFPLDKRKPRSPMPYCMFFRGGFAIHGSYHVPKHNASHGCIRVKPKAAKWLSKNFISNGTRVEVRPYY